MKRIVLCADDFGQAQHISSGILDLVKLGRLSAVSCMVNTPVWPEHAAWIKPFHDRIDLGLHFNLTEGRPLSAVFRAAYGEVFPGLSRLLSKAFLGKLAQTTVEAECHAQIDNFAAAMGFLPQFIDGHQHVHQFPIVRQALIGVYKQRLRMTGAYVRLINVERGLMLKPWIIYLTGTRGLRRLLDKNKIPYNQSFAGIYEFSLLGHYARSFSRFLAQSRDGGIIMCHPGYFADTAKDGIAKARFEEFQYLSSEQFLAACAQQKVTLERFNC